MKERALIALLLAALRQLDHAYSESFSLPAADISTADLRAAWGSPAPLSRLQQL